MSAVPADLDTYLTTHDARIQRELFDYLRIPSVSARSEHDADTARAAEWTAQALRDAGLEARTHARDAQIVEQLPLDAGVVGGEIRVEIGWYGAHRSA